MSVIYVAKIYMVDGLLKECYDYFESNLTTENVCVHLEQLHPLDNELGMICRAFISDFPYECINSPAFCDLCQTCVSSITESDDLCVTENDLYEAVMKWSEAKCNRQDLIVDNVHRRQVLGNILYAVRFPLMEEKCLMNCDLVTTKQVDENKGFKSSKRNWNIQHAQRFNSWESSWDHYLGCLDAISFHLSDFMHIHGIGIYGCVEGATDYSVTLQLLDQTTSVLKSTEQTIATDHMKDVYDVMFKVPHRLQPETIYTVTAGIKGLMAKKGIGGQKEVQLNGITVTFIASDKSENGTNTDRGQIPCLFLSK